MELSGFDTEGHGRHQSVESLVVDPEAQRGCRSGMQAKAELVLRRILETEVRVAAPVATGPSRVVEGGVHQELQVRRHAEFAVARHQRGAAEDGGHGKPRVERRLGAELVVVEVGARIEEIVPQAAGEGDVRKPSLCLGIERAGMWAEIRGGGWRHRVTDRRIGVDPLEGLHLLTQVLAAHEQVGGLPQSDGGVDLGAEFLEIVVRNFTTRPTGEEEARHPPGGGGAECGDGESGNRGPAQRRCRAARPSPRPLK